jgi:6-phosphofructokinase 1
MWWFVPGAQQCHSRASSVHSLYYLYGANKVYGIRGGFHGFAMENPDDDPVLLTNEIVENIYHEGGTILQSSRGDFDNNKIIDVLNGCDISQLYIIGGDGTHRGAYA